MTNVVAQRVVGDVIQTLLTVGPGRSSGAVSHPNWEQAVQSARAALPAGAWTIHHPGDWSAAEQAGVAASVAAERADPPRFQPDDRIRAGLRIVAAGNVVDATADGLLADRDDIGGRLIGLLDAADTERTMS